MDRTLALCSGDHAGDGAGREAARKRIPGPWPARGSTTTIGGFVGSIVTSAGGTMRTST
jgi:hypothetical protein